MEARSKVEAAAALLREAADMVSEDSSSSDADRSGTRRAAEWAQDVLDPPLTPEEQEAWDEVSDELADAESSLPSHGFSSRFTKSQVRDYVQDFLLDTTPAPVD